MITFLFLTDMSPLSICAPTWQMNPVEEHCRTQRLNFLFFLFLSSLSVQVVINTGSSSIKGSWRTCKSTNTVEHLTVYWMRVMQPPNEDKVVTGVTNGLFVWKSMMCNKSKRSERPFVHIFHLSHNHYKIKITKTGANKLSNKQRIGVFRAQLSKYILSSDENTVVLFVYLSVTSFSSCSNKLNFRSLYWVRLVSSHILNCKNRSRSCSTFLIGTVH